MDSVRLARVLGVGTRLAAKTLAEAVDAATAPSPSTPNPSVKSNPSQQPALRTEQKVESAKTWVEEKTTQARQAEGRLKTGSKGFAQAIWEPFARLSGVLWLEVTGVFFGLFALSAGVAAWKLKGSFFSTATNHPAHMQFLLALTVALLFGYFCISSFLRAERRSRNSNK